MTQEQIDEAAWDAAFIAQMGVIAEQRRAAAAEAAAIAAAPLAEFRANLATWFVVHILGG